MLTACLEDHCRSMDHAYRAANAVASADSNAAALNSIDLNDMNAEGLQAHKKDQKNCKHSLCQQKRKSHTPEWSPLGDNELEENRGCVALVDERAECWEETKKNAKQQKSIEELAREKKKNTLLLVAEQNRRALVRAEAVKEEKRKELERVEKELADLM